MNILSVKKAIARVVFAVCLFVMFLLCNVVVHAEEQTTVIKVGYTLNYGIVKSPMVVGAEGYGCEYLEAVFDYVEGDYELEFVYCEWTEVSEMIQNGEIDLFGPVTYTETSADLYLYTEESFGDNFIFLSTLKGNEATYNNFANVDGSTIAVQENNPNEYLLYEYLEENGWEAEIVYFTDNDYESVMNDNEYDFCLCSSLQTFQNLTPVVNLGYEQAYYVSNMEHAELMNLIDAGMDELDEKEYMYQEKLYLKYYDYDILSDSYITQDEYDLLQEQELYYIGIQDIYGSISYKNEEGAFEGIVVDAMEQIAEIAGIQYVFVEVTEDTREEEFQMLDFSFLSYGENAKEHTVESTAFCEMPYVMVERVVDESEEIVNIGVLSYYGLIETQEEGYIFDREMVEYDSLVVLQEAYNKGEIDSLILTSSNMNLIRDDFEDMNFIATNLDMSLNLCLIFQDNYSEDMIEIFNKVVDQMDEKAIETSVLKYSTGETAEINITAIIRKYPYVVPVLIIFICVLVIVEISLTAKQRRSHLSQLLNYDKLTGLISGHKFEEDVQKALADDAEGQYSIITIDIDHFKYINDVFGYEIGDCVIKKVGNCISKISPQAILVGRNSSDIFVVLLKREKNEEHSLQFSDEDRGYLFSELVPYIGETYKISFSIGIYDIIDRGLNVNFMVDCANIARLEGKGVANTTIHKYDNHMDRKRMVSMNLIANMVQGINNHEFVVYYQPKVHLLNKEITGAEALVRWYRNEELIPPNDFIPLFEKNGFIEKLDFYVLEEVCQFIKKHPEVPKISVNLSGVTITKKGVAEHIIEVVERYKVVPEKLEFEVTETAFIDEFEQVVNALEMLRIHGFVISMDDFGVGISSLSRLKSMPIDILKIDREFIWDSIGNEKGMEILKNIINMATGLHLETIAEGIETNEQEQMLIALGCQMGQGYYYMPPVPEARFLETL